jgi:hypothetical protein
MRKMNGGNSELFRSDIWRARRPPDCILFVGDIDNLPPTRAAPAQSFLGA